MLNKLKWFVYFPAAISRSGKTEVVAAFEFKADAEYFLKSKKKDASFEYAKVGRFDLSE